MNMEIVTPLMAIIIGTFLPPLIKVVNNKAKIKKSEHRYAIALIVSVLIGLGLTFISSSEQVLQNSLLVATISQTVFVLFYKKKK